GSKGLIQTAETESRFHLKVESEANLLGVVYTDPGAMTGAPYEVVDAKSWVFAGTGLKNGDKFGTTSLHRRCPGGASGHETDKRTPSTPAGAILVARGLNPDDGGAEMIYYATPTGGAVFSAGSICHPSSVVVDDALSIVTGNVLNRFLNEPTV
ncbi:MAG: N,N-dimethylformamidase beta subunit family domain-containing protein, partial [Planctomycetia bacterium]